MANIPASTPGQDLRFLKMSGAGNDFVVIDDRGERIADPAALARVASVRRLSIGSDGLILVRNSERASFRMLYFNADGSVGDFCANGTRCAARFAFLQSISPASMTIETGHAIVGAEVGPRGEVTLSIPPPTECALEKPLRLADGSVARGAYLMVGVPHYVLFVEEGLWEMDINPLGREIRRHPDLPDGANVNFVSPRGGGDISVRTWERGVEGETLACGSGVVASSAVSLLTGRATAPVSVLTRSGITLRVEMRKSGDAAVEDLRLTGDARVVYEGTMTPETLKGFDPAWLA